MSHTPGPWKLEFCPKPYGFPYSVWGGVIEDVIAEGVSERNARLIAAAPELYEALEDLIEFLIHGDKSKAILRAKAALAQARGDEGEDENT